METIPHTFGQHSIFSEFGEAARVASLSGEDIDAYVHSLKSYRDNYAIAQTERRLGKEEGWKEGLAEGMEKGRREGMEKGRREGMQEAAIKLLQSGFDVTIVASTLKLPLEDVMHLKESL